MSGFLASLVNGDDSCGPVNPMAQLTKGLHGGADSVSRDRFTPVAGPSSSQGFRSNNLQPHEVEQDAAARAFFQQQQQPSHLNPAHHPHPVFDLNPLRQALPPGVPAWAADFQASNGRQGNSSPAAALSERAWEKSRVVDTHNAAPAPAWANDFAAHLQQGPQSHSPMSTTPMRMASPGPGMQGQAQYQPMMAAHGPFMAQQPMHMMNSPMSQFMPIYNVADSQMMHHAPTFEHDSGRIQEIRDDSKVAQDSSWETAFLQHLQKSPKLAAAIAEDLAQETPHESLTHRATSPTHIQNSDDPDLLSRTARELLDNIQHDLSRNDKMNNSSFMSLMRKLRDKEVKVDGNNMVDAHDAATTTAGPSSSGTRMAQDSSLQPQFSSDGSVLQPSCILAPGATASTLAGQTATEQKSEPGINDLAAAYDEMNAVMDDDAHQRERRKAMGAFVGDATHQWDDGMREHDFTHDHPQGRLYQSRADTAVRGATSGWEEDLDDFELDDALLKSGPMPPSAEQMNSTNAQQTEWANLQSQWEEFEATSSGIQQASSSTSKLSDYPFHQRNPYLQFTITNAHQMHDYHTTSRNLPAGTLLEREADVQLNPNDSLAWLSLGLKQQEAERESLAITALQRALELDGTLKEAWLALAVSYTNDNIRGKAYDAIERWVECKTEYAEVASSYKALNSSGASEMSTSDRHYYLTGLLVEMARAGTGAEHGVDADVQIALGVMFNASEDYEKACDCFYAALSVRPDDPHLYNRLGATLANSGKAEDAIEYYYKALELQPDFARATVNLAIACINLNGYRDAAEHLLRALAQQQASDADIGDLTPSLSHANEAEYVESSNLLWDTLATCCNSLGRSDLAQACAKKNLAPFREGVFAS